MCPKSEWQQIQNPGSSDQDSLYPTLLSAQSSAREVWDWGPLHPSTPGFIQ